MKNLEKTNNEIIDNIIVAEIKMKTTLYEMNTFIKEKEERERQLISLERDVMCSFIQNMAGDYKLIGNRAPKS